MFLLNKLAAISLFTGFFALGAPADSREVRCTFDIGSGETRFSAIVVKKSKGGPTYSKLASGSERLAIKRAVVDGALPDAVAQELKTLLMKFKRECETHGAKKFAGVATSGFRAAENNGVETLTRIAKETGILLSIVRGDEEAKLGYLAAEARIPAQERTRLAVWDIGGGSQQIAARSMKGFEIAAMEEWGAAAFKDKVFAQLRRKEKNLPLLPLSPAEVASVEKTSRDLARRQVPKTLAAKVRGARAVVAGIGGVHNEALLGLTRTYVRKGKRERDSAYTLEDAQELLKLVTGKTPDELKALFPESQYTEYLPTNAALVLGMMKELGIREVRALEVNLTDGLAADETAWR